MANFNLAEFNKAKTYKIEYLDIEQIVDNKYLWNFRNNNNLTQNRLANLLKVSKKTIEKWEQGKNPIKGASAVLIYLFNNNPDLMKLMYKETRNYEISNIDNEVEESLIDIKYIVEEEKDNLISYNIDYKKTSKNRGIANGKYKYAGI